MRVCAKNKGMQVVPPEWLQVEWDEGPQPCPTEWWYQSHMKKKRVARFQTDVLKLAQRRFAKERAVTQDELEDSGRKWLEEWSKGSKPKRKKWQVPAVDVQSSIALNASSRLYGIECSFKAEVSPSADAILKYTKERRWQRPKKRATSLVP